ncbi:hypothetical protein [Floridanema aerugineum]|uniref:Uncharacterized protein n=1 Tax=Floridaenema aerugineum BLCC-F46 TaxID=3153654 RepID=A0ABV4WXZ9_9CYAN
MADYKLPDYVTKRLRYFNNQFLQEQDFIDEQNYHVDRQRRHNRLLHTPGIADGLTVTASAGATDAQVSPGTAIDGKGRQILLSQSQPVAVKDNQGNLFKDQQKVFLVISYFEQESDDPPAGGGEGKTRWLEQPKIECYEQTNVPSDENTYLRLALLTIGTDGKIVSVDLSVRKLAGSKIGITDKSIKENNLDDVIRSKLVTNGNNHNHRDGEGGKIKHSSLDLTDAGTNPHGTTVDNVLDATKSKVSKRVFVQVNVPGIYNPDTRSSITDKGSVFVLNTSSSDSYGLVAKVAETADVPPDPNKTIPAAAVVAIAGRKNVYGIYTTALTPGYALNVDGKANFAGGLNSGHISDTFINASGQRLTTGDVVKLKGTPVTQFRGSQNKIPIAEVTLADRENDTLVIGIVDSEAIPEPGQPDTRVKPEDPSFIEDGGELYLVTLGVFAHCKADATDIPIEVGDLLTTSNKPGHAKKATDPKLGSIIGKALDPLEKGTGYISVFVNIQ